LLLLLSADPTIIPSPNVINEVMTAVPVLTPDELACVDVCCDVLV